MGVVNINKAKANLYKFAKKARDHKLIKEAQILKKSSVKSLTTRNQLPW